MPRDAALLALAAFLAVRHAAESKQAGDAQTANPSKERVHRGCEACNVGSRVLSHGVSDSTCDAYATPGVCHPGASQATVPRRTPLQMLHERALAVEGACVYHETRRKRLC